MAIAVNLYTKKAGEIKRFLLKYFQREETHIEDLRHWVHNYDRPLEAVDMISALMDNVEEFEITMSIQCEEALSTFVTQDNHNDLIKSLFDIYYHEDMI